MSSLYAFGQLAKALETSVGHEDPEVRARAASRAQRWKETLEGMLEGRIKIGSRSPIKGMPVWVTPEVEYGGFATGNAAAGGNVTNEEKVLAERIVAPQEEDDEDDTPPSKPKKRIRSRIFSHYVSDDGLKELYDMLDTGAYKVDLPEDAALLSVAWLLRKGDTEAAINVLETIMPFASTLKFAPTPGRPADHCVPIGFAWRITVDEAKKALAKTRSNPEVDVMKASLNVWNPLSDRFVALWYARINEQGWVDFDFDDDFGVAATRLLGEYDLATAQYKLPSKRGRNLLRLVVATRDAAMTGTISATAARLVRDTVKAMVEKRGAPGSTALTELRTWQRYVGAIPQSPLLAKIASERLDDLNGDEGIIDPMLVNGPITPLEAVTYNVPVGTDMPSAVRRVLQRAYAAPLSDVLERGSVPSAEVYASLLPKEVCRLVAQSYTDDSLNRLMAASYAAFSNRRSLLLFDYAHQVRITELPWVAAMDKYRVRSTSGPSAAEKAQKDVLVDAAQAVITHWPGTITPNPLISQMGYLARSAGMDTPLVEELAADIFMGDFTAKYDRAALLAATMLENTIYAKYYNIDKDTIQTLKAINSASGDEQPGVDDLGIHNMTPTLPLNPVESLEELCRKRLGITTLPTSYRARVVPNGQIIEQAQILTTHNLATFVELGTTAQWPALALAAWNTCTRLLRGAAHQPRPLRAIKNAAYAWRQTLFYVAKAEKTDGGAVKQFIDVARGMAGTYPSVTRSGAPIRVPRVDGVLHGLEDVANGGRFDAQGRSARGRRFNGWSQGPHWIFKSGQLGSKRWKE